MCIGFKCQLDLEFASCTSTDSFPLKSQVPPGEERVELDHLRAARWLLRVHVLEGVCFEGQDLVYLALCTTQHSTWREVKPSSDLPPECTLISDILGVCRPQNVSIVSGKLVHGE